MSPQDYERLLVAAHLAHFHKKWGFSIKKVNWTFLHGLAVAINVDFVAVVVIVVIAVVIVVIVVIVVVVVVIVVVVVVFVVVSRRRCRRFRRRIPSSSPVVPSP